MDLSFNYDAAIAGTELTIKGELTENKNLSITLSGHKAHQSFGSPAWWEYSYYFVFCHNSQNFILTYNSCTQGDGWFLEETHNADLNTRSSLVFHDAGNREKGKWCSVNLLTDPAAIDRMLGEPRPRHCRGY